MSNYSQVTAFTPKDSLSTGNPAKVIKGSDFDAEFAAISTAIISKADAANLTNVNNTSDLNKPISTATQTALDAKVTSPASSTDNTIPRFDGTTGKLLQGSTASIGDDGKLNVDSTGAVVIRMTRNGGTVANLSQEWFNGTNSWYAGVSGSNFWGIGYNVSGAIDNAQLRLDASGNLTLNAGAFGYGAGAGGTVTQVTSKSTTVTLNKPNGLITLNGAALASGATVAFTLNNSFIVAGDGVFANLYASTATADAYRVFVDRVEAGYARIVIQNYSGGSLSEAFTIKFAVIKGSTT